MDSEADYVKHYCQQWQGQTEVLLFDRSRVDCLTANQAIEFDWCRKWAEGIGQALYYGSITGKMPTVALICKRSEQRFIQRLLIAAPQVDLIVIPNDNE